MSSRSRFAHIEVLQMRVLTYLDGVSLTRASAASTLWRTSCFDDAHWRALVLEAWGWFVWLLPPRHTWRWLYKRLARPVDAAFCIVGGAEALAEEGYARAYSPATLRWSEMPPCTTERNMAAVVRDAAGGLVVLGGLMGWPLKTVERFDFEERQWRPLPSLMEARCCCSAALDLRGRIYVVGGGESMYRGANVLRSVEVADGLWAFQADGDGDGEGNCWRPAPAMLQARCAVGVASCSNTGELFAVGGYGGETTYHASAERLDVSDGAAGVWEALPSMTHRRSGANAAVGPDRRLYVLGGCPDGRTEHDTMEILDVRERSWRMASSTLHYGRNYNAAGFGPDGLLYVAGTFRHTGQLDVVERYDPRMDAWEELPPIGRPVLFSAGAFLF